MKRTPSLLIFIIVILFSLNCYLNFKNKRLKSGISQLTKNMRTILVKDSLIDSSCTNFFRLQYYCLFKEISEIIDIKQDLPRGPGAVIYFNDIGCGPCVVSLLMDLKILANKIGLKNISLVYRDKYTPIIENISNQIDFDIKLFPFTNIGNQFKSLDFSIIIFTDEENRIFYIYSPELFPLLRIDFFNNASMPTMK